MESHQHCGLLRRLVAISYDLLLLIALDFIATAIFLVFTGGVAVESANPFYKVYLLLIAYVYFVWQWTHGGQTLGMRAWKIRVISRAAGPITRKQASLRFFLSLLSWLFAGTGYLWALIDPEKYTFHDRFSKTRLIRVGIRDTSVGINPGPDK